MVEMINMIKPLDKIVVTRLKKADEFVKILYGDEKYFGGNQFWYSTHVGKVSGCGPVAAANILAYLAQTYPEMTQLYKYNLSSINQDDYLFYPGLRTVLINTLLEEGSS